MRWAQIKLHTLRRSPTPAFCCLCCSEHREDEGREEQERKSDFKYSEFGVLCGALSLNPSTPMGDTSLCSDFLTQQQGWKQEEWETPQSKSWGVLACSGF